MIDRSLLRHIDWILIALLILITTIGIIAIRSSSHRLTGDYALRQLIWMVFSLFMMFLFLSITYSTLISYSVHFYIACIAVLGGVLVFGNWIAGTKSWIRMPFFQIQPSEITKIAVILVLARFFSEFKKSRASLTESMISGGVVLLPLLLIALQPDLGTALSYVPIYLAALILAGINRSLLLANLILGDLTGIISWSFFLRDYQKDRVSTLLFPGKDPLGAGYHLQQSKIAIGSGGFSGKGYQKGTQSQLRFLPARHTDFIFSVIGEEFGFVGVVVVIGLFSLFVGRIFQALLKARDRPGVYLVFMVFFMLTSQFVINIFMTVGLFPVAGIPLPFLSYGGSSLLANYIAVSLVLNVRMRRFVNV